VKKENGQLSVFLSFMTSTKRHTIIDDQCMILQFFQLNKISSYILNELKTIDVYSTTAGPMTIL
jgi:hypothetical protein